MKSTDQKPEWSRARGLLADLKSAARRSLSAQILLGKELLLLKKKLGFVGSGRRPKEKPQVAVIVRNWDQWCRSELGISADTGDRYIACFDYALSRAKACKTNEPEAFRLLVTPAAELTGDELDSLAAHVGRLVKWDGAAERPLTQAQILEELGIVKPSKKLEGGDTSAFKKGDRQMTLEEWAKESFEQIPMKFDDLESEILRIKGSPLYAEVLTSLELDSPDAVASLVGIKESLQSVLDKAKACLERVLKGDLAKMLETVEGAIEEKMHGPAPKRSRKKTSHVASK